MSQAEKRIQFIMDQLEKRGIQLSSPVDAENKSSLDFVREIVRDVDPTKNAKYSMWLVNMFARGGFTLFQAPEIKSYLEIYEKSKNSIDASWRDINKIKSIAQLRDAIQPIVDGQKSGKEKAREAKREGSSVIISANGNQAVKLATYEAAVYFGKATRWCTTECKSTFERYSDNLMVLLFSNGKKIQAHDSSGQIMNEDDTELSHDRSDLQDESMWAFLTDALSAIKSKNIFLKYAGALKFQSQESLQYASDLLIDQMRSAQPHPSVENLVSSLPAIDDDLANKIYGGGIANLKGALLRRADCPARIIELEMHQPESEHISDLINRDNCPEDFINGCISRGVVLPEVAAKRDLTDDQHLRVILAAVGSQPDKCAKVIYNRAAVDHIRTLRTLISNRSLWRFIPKPYLKAPREVLVKLSAQPGLDRETVSGLLRSQKLDFSEIEHLVLRLTPSEIESVSRREGLSDRLRNIVARDGNLMQCMRVTDKKELSVELIETLSSRSFAIDLALMEGINDALAKRLFDNATAFDQSRLVGKKSLNEASLVRYALDSCDYGQALNAAANSGCSMPGKIQILRAILHEPDKFSAPREVQEKINKAYLSLTERAVSNSRPSM